MVIIKSEGPGPSLEQPLPESRVAEDTWYSMTETSVVFFVSSPTLILVSASPLRILFLFFQWRSYTSYFSFFSEPCLPSPSPLYHPIVTKVPEVTAHDLNHHNNRQPNVLIYPNPSTPPSVLGIYRLSQDCQHQPRGIDGSFWQVAPAVPTGPHLRSDPVSARPATPLASTSVSGYSGESPNTQNMQNTIHNPADGVGASAVATWHGGI